MQYDGLGHVSELLAKAPGTFMTVDDFGTPVLVCRDAGGILVTVLLGKGTVLCPGMSRDSALFHSNRRRIGFPGCVPGCFITQSWPCLVVLFDGGCG